MKNIIALSTCLLSSTMAFSLSVEIHNQGEKPVVYSHEGVLKFMTAKRGMLKPNEKVQIEVDRKKDTLTINNQTFPLQQFSGEWAERALKIFIRRDESIEALVIPKDQ